MHTCFTRQGCIRMGKDIFLLRSKFSGVHDLRARLSSTGARAAYVCSPSFTISYGMAVTVSIFTPSSIKPSRGPLGRRLVTGIFSARPRAQSNFNP